jgi:hypothetical protein
MILNSNNKMGSTWKITNESNEEIKADKGKYYMVLDNRVITNKNKIADALISTFYLQQILSNQETIII